MPDVLILAAGRGQRLRPLTDATPKALLRVGGKPLLEHHLERLAAQGFGDVVINLAWLGGQIRERIGDGKRFGLRIRYSEEPSGALETGGGVVNALGLLRSDPFIVLNSDILSDFDYGDFNCADLGLPEPDDLRLVLAPNPPHHPRGDFAVERGRLVAAAPGGRNGNDNWTYTGIGCFRRRAFDAFAPARFPLRPVIERAMAAGLAGAEIYRGRWIDVGAPERLAQARQQFG